MSSQKRSLAWRSRQAALADMKARLRTSWRWAEPGFERALDYLLTPEAREQGEKIWQTRHKAVWKIQLPPELGGLCAVLKSSDKMRPLFYSWNHSKIAREAANYRALASLGIPMARLLAAGDTRRNFILQDSYLVTEFAAGCQDGRVFIRGGELAGETGLRRAFIEENLSYLAKLHMVHCFHKGFTPYNLLWKPGSEGRPIDLRWIDVSSCCFLPLTEGMFTKYLVRDIANFFWYLKLDETEKLAALRHYLSSNTRTPLSDRELLHLVDAAIAERDEREQA